MKKFIVAVAALAASTLPALADFDCNAARAKIEATKSLSELATVATELFGQPVTEASLKEWESPLDVLQLETLDGLAESVAEGGKDCRFPDLEK